MAKRKENYKKHTNDISLEGCQISKAIENLNKKLEAKGKKIIVHNGTASRKMSEILLEFAEPLIVRSEGSFRAKTSFFASLRMTIRYHFS